MGQPGQGQGNSFNPRLPLLGGDAFSFAFRFGVGYSFNPRLPLLGGDADTAVATNGAALLVSIHASRCWEAMPVDTVLEEFFTLTVSIHASRCWEAMPCRPARRGYYA